MTAFFNERIQLEGSESTQTDMLSGETNVHTRNTLPTFTFLKSDPNLQKMFKTVPMCFFTTV